MVNPSVKVELLTNAGNIPIPSAQKITSTNQIKTLLINGKHHLTMNTNTALFVESLVEHNNIGCLVKLDSGRIYTHVEHDGNPFIVDTAHGKAVITGTTFDIKATENSTTLVVSEGIVKFESDKGVVNVAAGQTSEIVGQSAPSIPLSCNTVELTAWATGYKPNNTLDQIKSTADSYDVAELSLFGAKSPIDLESINYDNWLEENRDWFKREFPWIFRLKNALAKEGIEVDYPELLITSGDIWQFVYPEVSATRFPVLDPESLLKIATHYGYDSQWLFKVVPDATIVHQMSENVCFGLKAFEKWISCFDKPLKLSKEVDSSVLFYSLHASVYLAKTKTLVWLCVEKSSYAGEKKDETELLTLHQKQVCTAHDNLQLTIQLMTTQREPCTTEYGDLLNRMIQNIAFLSACEEQIKNLQE